MILSLAASLFALPRWAVSHNRADHATHPANRGGHEYVVQREALREDGNDGQDFGKQCFPGPIDYGRPRVARHIAQRISDAAHL